MKITTTISVEIEGEGAGGKLPRQLTWQYSQIRGDNPRFYASSVRDAIERAAEQATQSVDLYKPAD